MSTNYFCSTCGTDQHLKSQSISTEFEIKGKKIPYTYNVYVCEMCGEYVSSPEQNDEILKGVYDAYKSENGFLLTDEIIGIRKKYKLSLRDFSKILGVSHITYHRYEKGAIPEPSLNNLLVLIKENPENLLILFEKAKTKFKPTVAKKIEFIINDILSDYSEDKCSSCSYQQYFQDNYMDFVAEMPLTVFDPYILRQAG